MDNVALWTAIAAACIGGIVAAVLIVLVKKNVLSMTTVEKTAELMDTIEVSGDGFVAQLYEYARMAVHAVEQLAKTGVIDKAPESKKAAALKYVENFAAIDEFELNAADMEAADALIEAAVQELPRNQQ